jgi:hypothetical protein
VFLDELQLILGLGDHVERRAVVVGVGDLDQLVLVVLGDDGADGAGGPVAGLLGLGDGSGELDDVVLFDGLLDGGYDSSSLVSACCVLQAATSLGLAGVTATRRSLASGATTIRSSMGSSGMVITSTIALSSSSSSTTPPLEPAGAVSTASVSSTVSNRAILWVVGMGFMLGDWEGGHKAWGGLCIGVVPSRSNGCGARIDRDDDLNFAGETVGTHLAKHLASRHAG